jgi:transposase
VHVPTELSRSLKSTCGNREELIECRTKLINNVRGWLRTQLWHVRQGSTTTFVLRTREHAKSISEVIPEHIERTLPLIDELTKQIRAADKQLAQTAKAHPICQKLMTIPGVGPVTAVRFVAAIDEVGRFRSAHAVQSYIGLTPGEQSSSEDKRRTSITKAGPRALRKTLVQAAWCMMRKPSNDPTVLWAQRLAERKHKFVAVVALARKLAGIMFALWRDGSTYKPRPEHTPS